MSMRAAMIGMVGLGAVLFGACGGGGGPTLEGFIVGGFAGYSCPPASVGSGNCNDPDCAVGCVATTVCDPASPACPVGYKCDATVAEKPYCMPETLCDSVADCPSGQGCSMWGISKGICVPAPNPPAACDANKKCDWAYECNNLLCELHCNSQECPAGLTCADGFCQP